MAAGYSLARCGGCDARAALHGGTGPCVSMPCRYAQNAEVTASGWDCCKGSMTQTRLTEKLPHLQDDDMRIPKTLEEGFEDPLVVIGYAVVFNLVPGILCFCEWLR